MVTSPPTKAADQYTLKMPTPPRALQTPGAFLLSYTPSR
jgi:hypothetical protein